MALLSSQSQTFRFDIDMQNNNTKTQNLAKQALLLNSQHLQANLHMRWQTLQEPI